MDHVQRFINRATTTRSHLSSQTEKDLIIICSEGSTSSVHVLLACLSVQVRLKFQARNTGLAHRETLRFAFCSEPDSFTFLPFLVLYYIIVSTFHGDVGTRAGRNKGVHRDARATINEKDSARAFNNNKPCVQRTTNRWLTSVKLCTRIRNF